MTYTGYGGNTIIGNRNLNASALPLNNCIIGQLNGAVLSGSKCVLIGTSVASTGNSPSDYFIGIGADI